MRKTFTCLIVSRLPSRAQDHASTALFWRAVGVLILVPSLTSTQILSAECQALSPRATPLTQHSGLRTQRCLLESQALAAPVASVGRLSPAIKIVVMTAAGILATAWAIHNPKIFPLLGSAAGAVIAGVQASRPSRSSARFRSPSEPKRSNKRLGRLIRAMESRLGHPLPKEFYARLSHFLGSPGPDQANAIAILQWLGRRTLPALAYHHLILSISDGYRRDLDSYRQKTFGNKESRQTILESWLGKSKRALLKKLRQRPSPKFLERPRALDELVLGLFSAEGSVQDAQDVIESYVNRLKDEKKQKRLLKDYIDPLPESVQSALQPFLPEAADQPDMPVDAILGDALLDLLVSHELARQLGLSAPVRVYRQLLKEILVENVTLEKFMRLLPGWPQDRIGAKAAGQYFERALARVYMEHSGLLDRGGGIPESDHFARAQYARAFAPAGERAPDLSQLIGQITKRDGEFKANRLSAQDKENLTRAFVQGWLRKPDVSEPPGHPPEAVLEEAA